jgi:hypothetical protein
MPPAASVADSAQASCRPATARARTAPAAPAALAGAAGPMQTPGPLARGAESAAREIQGGRAAQEAGAQFAAPTSRWPGRALTRQRSRPVRPARDGGAADSAPSDPPRAQLPGLLGSTRAGPLAGPAENHKPARELRALSSSRQGSGRRLKKGGTICPPTPPPLPSPPSPGGASGSGRARQVAAFRRHGLVPVGGTVRPAGPKTRPAIPNLPGKVSLDRRRWVCLSCSSESMANHEGRPRKRA